MLKCKCGKYAFVKDVLENPFPDNPNPCLDCYLKVCDVRNKNIRNGKPQAKPIRRYYIPDEGRPANPNKLNG